MIGLDLNVGSVQLCEATDPDREQQSVFTCDVSVAIVTMCARLLDRFFVRFVRHNEGYALRRQQSMTRLIAHSSLMTIVRSLAYVQSGVYDSRPLNESSSSDKDVEWERKTSI